MRAVRIGFDAFRMIAGVQNFLNRAAGNIENADGTAVLVSDESASGRKGDRIGPLADGDRANCFVRCNINDRHVVAGDVSCIGANAVRIDRDAERPFASCDRCSNGARTEIDD